MNKSVIVYGPQGCGKTRNAERIRKHFGLERIVDDFCGIIGPAFDKGILYLTCFDDPGYKKIGLRMISFAEVAQQINDAIPLTEWFGPDTTPGQPGIYKTREPDESEWFNYFDGLEWHFGHGEVDRVTHYANALPDYLMDGWRGLAEEPIVIQEAA
jgi:hypothetical protein